MELTIFLGSEAFVAAWINGGSVPLNLASSYISNERSGVMTPDECLTHENSLGIDFGGDVRMTFFPSPSSPYRHPPGLYLASSANIKTSAGTWKGPGHYNGYYEDGLILCFSSNPSRKQMKRFGGKVAGVNIVDLALLKSCLDDQVGVISKFGRVRYTERSDRNPFLKSKLDEWQSEFRLYWKIVPKEVPLWVSLPRSVARILDISTLPD